MEIPSWEPVKQSLSEFLFESIEFHAEEIKVFRNKSLLFYIDLL